MLNVHELTLNKFWNGALIPGNRAGKGKKEGDEERIPAARHHAAEMAGEKSPILRDILFYRLEGPSMIALWLMFQPPPSAVYRDTSVLAC